MVKGPQCLSDLKVNYIFFTCSDIIAQLLGYIPMVIVVLNTTSFVWQYKNSKEINGLLQCILNVVGFMLAVYMIMLFVENYIYQ